MSRLAMVLVHGFSGAPTDLAPLVDASVVRRGGGAPQPDRAPVAHRLLELDEHALVVESALGRHVLEEPQEQRVAHRQVVDLEVERELEGLGRAAARDPRRGVPPGY